MPPLAALFAWPIVSLILFRIYEVRLAIIVVTLAGFLLLPEGIAVDLPLLPPLNKNTVTALSTAFIAAALVSTKTLPTVRPGLFVQHSIARGFIVLLILGTFLTVLTNGDPLSYGPRRLPGMRIYDALSVILGAIMLMVPLALGRKYLSDVESHRLILICLCYAGLAYSLLALFEIRMSPRLNSMVYGFFPHEWKQHIRSGGFRPLVFLRHGLVLAIFFCFCIIASFGLARIIPERKGFFIFSGCWLLGTLVLSNSLGALLIAILILPLVWWTSRSFQLLAAFVVAVAFLMYPILRSTNVVPVQTIADQVAVISEERAASLETRLKNEDRFLEKLNQRPWFGWGGWGRSRIFDEKGQDITTADGHWIIQLSVGGWARYLSEIGLFSGPIILLFLRRRTHPVAPETAVLAMILAANMLDLVPNTSLTPISLLISGMLWGRIESAHQDTVPATPTPPAGSRSNSQPPMRGSQSADPDHNPYTRQTQYIQHRRRQ